MCHIFYCISLSIDLLQRAITYAFGCFLCMIIFFLLLGSLLAGLTYGYKYYVAEWVSLNFTLRGVRKMDMYRQEKLAEYDPRMYEKLMRYWIWLNTSTTTTTTTTTPAPPPSPATPSRMRLLRKYYMEDDVNRDDLEEPIESESPPSPEQTAPGIKDYVKKQNWVIPDRKMMSDRPINEKKNDDQSNMNFVLKLHEKNKSQKYPNRNIYSEFSGFPVNEVFAINSISNKNQHEDSSKRKPDVPSRSTAVSSIPEDIKKSMVLSISEAFKRSTAVSFTPKNITRDAVLMTRTTIDIAPSVVKNTTKKGIALEILQKLMATNNVNNTKKGTPYTTTNIPPKQYIQILNWLLSQKNKLKTSTEKEKIFIV